MAAYASPVLPAYAPIWPEGYPDLQSRRDSQVYNLLQQEAARADKIREENRQIAAERADLQNNDKHKGRSKARSPDREKGPRICKSCGEHTWEQMPFGACDACGMRAALKKSFPTNWESREAAKDDDDDADIPAAPKTRKAAWENRRKAPRKAKAVKEGNQFYAQFVAGSHPWSPLGRRNRQRRRLLGRHHRHRHRHERHLRLGRRRRRHHQRGLGPHDTHSDEEISLQTYKQLSTCLCVSIQTARPS